MLTETAPIVAKGIPGKVYLIHFDQPLHHAQHYLGWTENEDWNARLTRHRNGWGSSLLRAVTAEGIKWEVVRVWQGVDRHFERWLKNQKRTKDFCPVCSQQPRQVRGHA
jgi:hypothetical protein